MKKLMIVATMLAALLVAALPAFGQQEDYEATLSFKLAVEGQPPAGATFYGFVPAEGGMSTQLTDPDKDGVYTGSMEVPKYAPGPRPVPESIDPVTLPVQIVWTLETRYGHPLYPTVIKYFGAVLMDGDKTFTASTSFEHMAIDEPETGGSLGEAVYGTDGFDRLSGTRGDDLIMGFGGDDVISEGYGNDLLRGGTGWDYVVGGYGDDALYGEAGGDWLDGGAGGDYVDGGAGGDHVDGGTGNDQVNGGDGNDAVYGYKGSDVLNGGDGNDLVYSANDATADKVSGGPGYDVCIVGFEDTVTGGCEEIYRY